MTKQTSAQLIGIDSDTSTCECCGKTNLKRVAVIRLPSGEIVRYGRDCAARKLGKSYGKSVDLLVEVTAYIAKWSAKYSDTTIIAKGLWNKFGLTATYDGQWHIHGIGSI
jgi:hypothetical protein